MEKVTNERFRGTSASSNGGLYRDNNSFFKGKVGGKIVNKSVIDEKMRRITESMGDQIDKMADLTLEQKEYMH